jgi:phosphonate transport system substrate-binding protein
VLRTVLAATLIAVSAPAIADTVRFAVTDIEGLESLQAEFAAFEAALESSTGLDVELFPVSSRTAAVEAINADQVDLVLTGPAEYVVINSITDVEIVTAWQRPEYYAQIVVLADGPIDTVADLKGKIVTFGSVGSTSQHLGPAQVMTDNGLTYGVDYDAQILSRNVAVEALIRGDIQAVGMNAGHLSRIREAFPDNAFRVVARGPDLPNDILVARADLDPQVVEAVRNAFVNDSAALMAAVLQGEDNQKYRNGVFLPEIDDADYDYVRAMYATIGVDTNAFVGD